jgi:hypothetical protein
MLRKDVIVGGRNRVRTRALTGVRGSRRVIVRTDTYRNGLSVERARAGTEIFTQQHQTFVVHARIILIMAVPTTVIGIARYIYINVIVNGRGPGGGFDRVRNERRTPRADEWVQIL